MIDMNHPIIGRDRAISHTFGKGEIMPHNYNINDNSSILSKDVSNAPLN